MIIDIICLCVRVWLNKPAGISEMAFLYTSFQLTNSFGIK